MSGTIETTAKIIIIGSLVGITGLVALGNSGQPAEATQTPVVAPAPVKVAPPAAEAPKAPDHALSVDIATSGSIRSGSHGFATFRVKAATDVADAKLVVDCSEACEIARVPQRKSSKAGAGVRVELGELAAGDEKEVLVVFELNESVADFNTRTSYTDLHADGAPTVMSMPTATNISSMLSNPEVYLSARLALSADAVDEAREHMDAKEFDDARDVIDRAHDANVKVGMAMRFGGKLRDAQDEFDMLRSEIAVLTAPKKRRRAPKPRKIDIVRGDR